MHAFKSKSRHNFFLLFCFALIIKASNAQNITIELPKFYNYFTQTQDTIAYYKSGGTPKGEVKHIMYRVDNYPIISTYYNQKGEPVNHSGKKLQVVKTINQNTKEIYSLDAHPNQAGERTVNNEGYYLSYIINYNSQNLITNAKKVHNNLSESLYSHYYGKFNQLLNITEKRFRTVEVANEEGTDIAEIRLETAPSYIKISTPIYNGKRLVSLTIEEKDEYSDSNIKVEQTYTYLGSKATEVVQKTSLINKETHKSIEKPQTKRFKIYRNAKGIIEKTILSYKDQKGNQVTQETNYTQQTPSLPNQVIQVTTRKKSTKEDTTIQSITIKRDTKQNIQEVTTTSNNKKQELITFKYTYF